MRFIPSYFSTLDRHLLQLLLFHFILHHLVSLLLNLHRHLSSFPAVLSFLRCTFIPPFFPSFKPLHHALFSRRLTVCDGSYSVQPRQLLQARRACTIQGISPLSAVLPLRTMVSLGSISRYFLGESWCKERVVPPQWRDL